MKKLSLFLFAFILVFAACDKDKEEETSTTDFVSQTAEKKTVLLEEFTGVKCGYCPQGHAIAADMIANNPGKVIAISIHGGSYSTPYSGDQDLSTTWADQLISFSNLTGFPSAMVSRTDHDNDNIIATSRSNWESIGNDIMTEDAPVNIAIRSEYASGVATITVQVYYTADGGGENLLNVAITENGIQTQQAGADENPYTHKHVLLDLLTGQWGETISTTSTGTTQTFQYSYTTKNAEVAANCEVTAYITKADKTEVLNADITSLVNGEVN